MFAELKIHPDLYISVVTAVFELSYQRRLIIWKYVLTILHTLQTFLKIKD